MSPSLAANYPEKVKKVILGEGALPGFGLEKLMDVAQGGSWHFGFQMQADFAARVIEGNEEVYFSNFWNMMAPVKGIDSTSRKKYLSHYGSVEGSRGGFYHYATLLEDAEFNKKNPDNELQMPVLILNGDKGIPLEITEDSVKKVSKNYETAIIKNCGHTIGEENSEEAAKHILSFINK